MLSFLTNQTRSKYGPTLRASYVVLPVFTSRPLRLPYVHNICLAGFTQLDRRLPQSKYCGDAGISGPTSLSFTTCHWPYSGSHAGAYALFFPAHSDLLLVVRGSACTPFLTDLSLTRTLPTIPVRFVLRSCTIRFMLRPAVLAGTPDWVRPASLRAFSVPCQGKFSPHVTMRTRPLPTHP